MTPNSIAAFVICLATIGFAWTRVTITRLLISVLLLMVHVSASVFYYGYSQTAVADASSYYFDPMNMGSLPWQTGTVFVAKLCHLLRFGLGASYLDSFMFFQSFGFAGLMIMARVFDEIEGNLQVPERRGYWALLFLPSVNFWTSAIGKDAPLFFALSLCVWSMLKLRKRFAYFCISLAVMTLFRAHVALITVFALAASTFFGSSVSIGRKTGLLAIAGVGIWLTSSAVESSLGVDATSVSSVTAYLNQQNAVFANVSGTTSLGDAPFVVRAVSLLFRPFFFDAKGIQAIVASVENLGVALALLYMIFHWRDLLHLMRRVPFIRFCALFSFILLFLLTLVYYNVGLGLRERVMVYPTMFAILVSLWSLRERHKLAAAPRPDGRLMLDPKANTALVEL